MTHLTHFAHVIMTHLTHFADVMTHLTHFVDVMTHLTHFVDVMTHLTHFADVTMAHVIHFADVCSANRIANTAHEMVLGWCNCAWKLRLEARLSKVMTLSMLHLSRHLTL